MRTSLVMMGTNCLRRACLPSDAPHAAAWIVKHVDDLAGYGPAAGAHSIYYTPAQFAAGYPIRRLPPAAVRQLEAIDSVRDVLNKQLKALDLEEKDLLSEAFPRCQPVEFEEIKRGFADRTIEQHNAAAVDLGSKAFADSPEAKANEASWTQPRKRGLAAAAKRRSKALDLPENE